MNYIVKESVFGILDFIKTMPRQYIGSIQILTHVDRTASYPSQLAECQLRTYHVLVSVIRSDLLSAEVYFEKMIFILKSSL